MQNEHTTTPDNKPLKMLSALLVMISYYDGQYDIRNDLVLSALAQARTCGLLAGVRIDPLDPRWPVAFIELPTGQVSWHLPEHTQPWDGHSTETKWQRVQAFLDLYPPVGVFDLPPRKETSQC